MRDDSKPRARDRPAAANPAAPALERPTLLYDGDCDICIRWVGWYRARCGERLRFAPYQQALADYPALSAEACRRAIQFVAPDGQVFAGAAAAFRALALVPGRGWWWLAHRRVAGFGRLAEAGYRFTATHRGALGWITRACWGPAPSPPRYERVCELFFRLLGGVYVAAFASLAAQWPGLIGSGGILPLADYLELLQARWEGGAVWRAPTLFWLGASDAAIAAACWGGTALGAWLALAPGAGAAWGGARRLAAAGGFALYLSLFHAGQVFTAYQWDLLLLECGFLAIFLSGRRELSVWLFRWLLFRFMWLSGAVKLASGDPSWASWTAMQFHYETQPLPTALAWHAHQLPEWLHRLSVGSTLLIELWLPLAVFLPRRPRLCAAAGFALFEALILLTGNYNFFNWLTLFLCVFLLEDADLERFWPRRARVGPSAPARRAGARAPSAALAALALVCVGVGSVHLVETVRGQRIAGAAALTQWLAPYHVVNRYGLFAVMTTARTEIVVQGSNDGRRWLSYAFRYKPGALDRRPRWSGPHQPRLDWQMWFAALAPRSRSPWFDRFAARLLEGSPAVRALLESDPFAGAPPRYLRALRYRYRFTEPDERRRAGRWWRRELLGEYLPTAALRR